MNLFSDGNLENILPKDGTALYFGVIMTVEQANHYLKRLLNTIEWKNDEAIIFGKHIITKRKVAWYGDENYSYTYSNTTKTALPWTKELIQLKKLVETNTGATYNSCLLNLYHDGSEGMAWHSDDEKMLSRNGSIASLSLGAERKFAFKHKHDQQIVSMLLEHGSLLEMKDETQTNWLHRLPPTTLVKRPRVNLTFRQMM
ncbi:MAG: alpha-ketoglutarate-dependent dioxygenase AlkB [Fluviicola sp.]|nr:alpha-ketoglutarate-dependent dioxygenase AlkB [Fluviicola sp.]